MSTAGAAISAAYDLPTIIKVIKYLVDKIFSNDTILGTELIGVEPGNITVSRELFTMLAASAKESGPMSELNLSFEHFEHDSKPYDISANDWMSVLQLAFGDLSFEAKHLKLMEVDLAKLLTDTTTDATPHAKFHQELRRILELKEISKTQQQSPETNELIMIAEALWYRLMLAKKLRNRNHTNKLQDAHILDPVLIKMHEFLGVDIAPTDFVRLKGFAEQLLDLNFTLGETTALDAGAGAGAGAGAAGQSVLDAARDNPLRRVDDFGIIYAISGPGLSTAEKAHNLVIMEQRARQAREGLEPPALPARRSLLNSVASRRNSRKRREALRSDQYLKLGLDDEQHLAAQARDANGAVQAAGQMRASDSLYGTAGRQALVANARRQKELMRAEAAAASAASAAASASDDESSDLSTSSDVEPPTPPTTRKPNAGR